MPIPLLYHDRPMTSDVFTLDATAMPLTTRHVRAALLGGAHLAVVFEPGDATRYDLVLTPIMQFKQPGLLVTRLRGGEVSGTILLWDWHTGASAFEVAEGARILAAGNEWTTALLAWWLAIICDSTAT